MPEGPEIKCLTEKLKRRLKGKEIFEIKTIGTSPITVEPAKILSVKCKGKVIYIKTNKYYLFIRLSLSGWVRFGGNTGSRNSTTVDGKDNIPNPETSTADHIRYSKTKNAKYIIYLSSPIEKMYITSQRKFSKIFICQDNLITGKLGVDIFSPAFSLSLFKTKIKSRKMMISAFLLSQKIFCGIGNYIRNEALYISKIHPRQKTNKLTDIQIKDLYNAIRFVIYSKLLTQCPDLKGKLVGVPKKLEIPYKYRVYQQKKDPNGNVVSTMISGGRRSFFVKKLQIISS